MTFTTCLFAALALSVPPALHTAEYRSQQSYLYTENQKLHRIIAEYQQLSEKHNQLLELMEVDTTDEAYEALENASQQFTQFPLAIYKTVYSASRDKELGEWIEKLESDPDNVYKFGHVMNQRVYDIIYLLECEKFATYHLLMQSNTKTAETAFENLQHQENIKRGG